MLASQDVVSPRSSLVTQPRSERERDSKVREPVDRGDKLAVLGVFESNCISIFLVGTTRQFDIRHFQIGKEFHELWSSICLAVQCIVE